MWGVAVDVGEDAEMTVTSWKRQRISSSAIGRFVCSGLVRDAGVNTDVMKASSSVRS